ncbi:protein DDC8 homolog [Ictidomys tridecemlineatus]
MPSSSPHDSVMLLRQKHTTLKVREPEDDSPLPRRPNLQWRAQQLLQLAEELQAEWQEAQLLEDLEQLCSTHVLGGATAGWAVENEAQAEAEADLEKPAPRGAERSPKVKDKHRVALREPKSHQEELPRQQARRPKPQRKAVGSERQGATKPRGLGPTEKSKRKRLPSSKTSSGRQPVTPRVGRSVQPHLASGEELRGLQEKQRAREGRRKAGKGTTVHFARGLRNISEKQGPRDRLEELQQLWPASSTHRREAVTPSTPDKCIPKNRWQRELESAFEQLFNSNRKLKRHLSQHLDSRSRLDPDPQEQVFSVLQGCESDTPQEGAAEVESLPAGESGDPAEAEVSPKSSKTDLKQSLSREELPRCHQMAQPAVKDGSQTSLAEADAAIDEEDLLFKSTECEQEASELATLMDSCPQPHLPEQAHRADWTAFAQKPPRLELEWRRQKPSFESVELPDMSLEIHYSAELEEERKERRRLRLALLKSYPSSYQIRGRVSPSPVKLTSSSNSSLIEDEGKQNQMIRDIQLQISEQNKLHEQFLEKARKRLLEFQRIC